MTATTSLRSLAAVWRRAKMLLHSSSMPSSMLLTL